MRHKRTNPSLLFLGLVLMGAAVGGCVQNSSADHRATPVSADATASQETAQVPDTSGDDTIQGTEISGDKSSCSFKYVNFDGADSIRILNGANGQEVIVTEPAKIEQITWLISRISGSDGVSSRGHSGYLYHVKIYSADSLLFEITFVGNEGDKQYFNYGIYETEYVNGKVNEYAGRYVMEGADTNSLELVFGVLFKNGVPTKTNMERRMNIS